MTPDAYCQQKAARSGSSFYYSFLFLPPERRRAITALYAFCREVDDVADHEATPVAERREQLAAWRADVRRASGDETPHFAVNRELQPVIRQYHLPFEHFDALLHGCIAEAAALKGDL